MKKLALEFETISNELKHENAQLLLVTITSNLYWDVHVSEMVKKASKRLGFLGAVKASLCQEGRFAQVLHQLHTRSVCNYAIPVFHARLPQYLIDDLERVQKRALSIICPTLSYNSALASLELELLLVVHNQRLCQSLFDNILEDRDHRLHHLLPDSHSYTPRHAMTFYVKFKTCRPRNCFIHSQCLRVNSLEQRSVFLNKTLFVVIILYVYVEILQSYNFCIIDCNLCVFYNLVVFIFYMFIRNLTSSWMTVPIKCPSIQWINI